MTEHKSFYEALGAVQAELEPLRKDSTNPHFKSKFVSLDNIGEHVGPVLTEHGLTWSTFPCFGPNGEPALRYKLTHIASGDSESDVMPLLVQKQDPQGQGSGITYARRYSITAVLNLVADEDDDGNSATHASKPGDTTITKDDAAELTTMLAGLKNADIKLAFSSVGLDATQPLSKVPKGKLPALVGAIQKAKETA